MRSAAYNSTHAKLVADRIYFFIRQTSLSSPVFTNPFGCSMKSSSFRSALRKAERMSSCNISRSSTAAIDKISIIEFRRTNGTKVSSKSTPGFAFLKGGELDFHRFDPFCSIFRVERLLVAPSRHLYTPCSWTTGCVDWQ